MAENEVLSGLLDPPGVSNAELRVLQSLWERGASTIRQLTERLYPTVTTANYSTPVAEAACAGYDRCVSRDRSTTPHVFVAAISRDDYIGGQLRAMAEKFCGGSVNSCLLTASREATEALSRVKSGANSANSRKNRSLGRNSFPDAACYGTRFDAHASHRRGVKSRLTTNVRRLPHVRFRANHLHLKVSER